MKIQVKRIRQGKNSILSHVYIDGRLFCYGLEDVVCRSRSGSSTPLIQQGCYRLGLRKYGAMHARYSRRFRDMHQGVLHLLGVPDQAYAYIRVGKVFCDADGGLLVGKGFLKDEFGDYKLKKSTKAYRQLYQHIITAASDGTVEFI